MKASKQFATTRGTSHQIANMKHTTAETIGVETPANDQHMVILQFTQRRESGNSILKVRMTAIEAQQMADALVIAAGRSGVFDV